MRSRFFKRSTAFASGRLALAAVMVCALALAAAPTAAFGSWWAYSGPRLASQTPMGDPGNAASWGPQLTDDGRYVVFDSNASDLSPNDPTPTGQQMQDVFTRDMMARACTLVADPPAGSAESTRLARDGSISDDGRYIAFFTRRSLVSSDTNGGEDLYVRDMRTGAYQRASLNGTQSPGDSNYGFEMSGNDRYVVFYSWAALSPEDLDSRGDVYRWDRESDETTLVTKDRPGASTPNPDSYEPHVSDDGRYVAFMSHGDFDAADTNGNWDLYVRDMVTGEYTRCTSNGNSGWWPSSISMSGDGAYLCFDYGGTLLPGELNSARDVYRWSRASGETTLVSSPRAGGTQTNRGSRSGAMSDDGRYIALYSGQDFVASDTNDAQDLYVRDMTTAAFRRVIVADGPGDSPWSGLWNVTISGDGSTIAFEYSDQGPSGGGLRVASSLDDETTPRRAANFAPTGREQIYVVSLNSVLSTGTARLAGTDRYGTAIEISKMAFPSSIGAKTVVIASGEDWPDALCASALSGAVLGPVLLTPRGALPAAVKTELARLGARDAYIVGGTSALSVAVEDQLNAALPGTVSRISGTDRYDTSKAVAKAIIDLKGSKYNGNAMVTTGLNFPDALAAAPLASGLEWPILLSNTVTVTVPAETARVAILGGTAAVPTAVETGLKTRLGASNVIRLAGGNRYDTATKVAAHGVSNGLLWNGVGIASGETFPDALSGGAALGMQRTVLLLTPAASLDPTAAATLTANKSSISTVRFLGGTAAVSTTVANAVKAILGL